MTGPYLAQFWRCPNERDCDFAATPPSQEDPRAAQQCTRRLFRHLSSSACLAESGFEGTLEDYKKVSCFVCLCAVMLPAFMLQQRKADIERLRTDRRGVPDRRYQGEEKRQDAGRKAAQVLSTI